MSEQVQPLASATGGTSALEGSLVELRALEKMLFQNGQRQAGVFLSQVKLIATKVEHGITATRSDFLSLLDAASRMPRRGE